MSSAVESPPSPSPSSSFDSSTDETHPQDLTKIRIKTEDGTDEVKVFSASTDLKKEIDADVDVDGIEDRLSPVVEEPTSPTKTEPTVGNLYPPAFLYPYFHPMWNPYLMAAAAQAQTPGVSAEKLSADPFPAAPPGPFGGVPFPGLYPPNMANPSFQPNLFNPFGIPIPTPGLRPSGASSMSDRPSGKDLNSLLESKRPRKPHIKKPLNAFMIYMKEQRAKVIEECTLKESSAINKVLGQKWKELSRAEQDRYYELAKEERNRHMQMYPGWSARDNYGLKKKRSSISHPEHPQKKFIRENHPASPLKALPKPSHLYENDCAAQKKCRARYGLEGLNQWCKHCRRKKKCTRFLEEDSNGTYQNNPMANPSSVNSPGPSENDESINDLDSDDILARQIDSIDDDDEQENSDEENQHHPRAQQFYPGFSY